MSTQRFLMNPYTGSVDTEEYWLAEMPIWDESEKTREEQFAELIEVRKVDGEWVEA